MTAEHFEQTIALERLVVAKGTKLRKRGKQLVAGCPFEAHEATDAFVIDPQANTWECKAGCGSGGVVDFVAKVEGVSRKHAAELLKADFMPEPDEGKKPKFATVPKLGPVVEPHEPDDVVLQQVADFYHQTLLQSPKALAYLHKRGLRDPNLVDHLPLGFCDRTLCFRLPGKNRQAGAAIRGQLQRLGVLRKSGHEHFRGCITVPLMDEAGRVVQMYGRKLHDNLRRGTQYHMTLTDEDVGVFNSQGFITGQKMILTAGVMDALTWWSYGHRNVTTTMGMATLPADVKAMLISKQIRSVALAFSRDKDTTAIADELREMGIETHEIVFPKGLDANALARKAENPQEALDAVLRAANWLSAPARRAVAATPPAGSQERVRPAEDVADAADEDHQVTMTFGERRWRVRGLENNTSHNTMRVNVYVTQGEAAGFHVDVIELYSARHRRAFLRAAAEELDVEERALKADMGKMLLHLEDIQDERIRQALEPTVTAVEIDEPDRQAALAFLKTHDLLERIVADFEVLGVVGEKANKLIAYLTATSRKLRNPLAVVIQSSSAAGKSSLMDAVLRLFPDEDKLSFSAMTGRSLFYLGEQQLTHKLLAVAEEEGAADASYALKILQSEGRLTIASTGKESKTGRLTTQTYEVVGPVALLLTTTAIDIDEELLSRCIVLTVDEGREQTRAIHHVQRHRKTLEGLLASQRAEQVVRLHHNAQRLLRPLHVVIPMAAELRFADHALRARRDHQKFLGLIEAVALLRQYGKDIKEADDGGVRVRYIEADEGDIRVAARLVNEALGRSLDELPPGTRKLLVDLYEMVDAVAKEGGLDAADVRFTRRDVRRKLGIGHTQLRVHLGRLVDMEYVVVHRGGQGRRFCYELAWSGDGDDGEPFVPGLQTSSSTIPTVRGQEANLAGGVRAVGGPSAAGVRGGKSAAKPRPSKGKSGSDARKPPKKAKGASKKQPRRSRTRKA